MEWGKVCRLCATTIEGKGLELFSGASTHWDNLVATIFGYLKVKCFDDGELPNWLCSACQLEAESTEKFLCLVRSAQIELRAESETPEDFEIIVAAKLKPNQYASEELKPTKKRGPKPVYRIREDEFKMTMPLDTTDEPLTAVVQDDEVSESAGGRIKRSRRAPKRFIDEVVARQQNKTSTSALTAQLKKQQADEDACARITKAPIAELRSSAGISLAEVIEVGTEQKTPICHSKLRLICDYCNEVFSKQNDFLKHLATHNSCVYECSECLKNFSTKSQFEAHQNAEQHTGLGIIENMLCSSEEAASAGNYSDGACDADAAVHIVVNANGQIAAIDRSKMEWTKATECSKSSAKLKARKVLQAKIAVKGVAASYACLKCEKTFTDHYAVRRHYRQVHEASEPFKCRQCLACFKTKSSYNYHMAKHTGQKPHLCSICGSSFIFKYELTLHNRIHTGDKPYTCKQCDKAFSHRSNLVVHERLHAGLRPFKCAKCDACFNTTSHLHAHKKVHLKQAQAAIAQNVADESCSSELLEDTSEFLDFHFRDNAKITSKSAKNSNSVSLLKTKTNESEQITHLEIESSALTIDIGNIARQHSPVDYKFQCHECFKYFRQKSALDKHIRTHTAEKPYKCPLCPKSFADGSNFKRHKLLHKNASDELRNVATNSASALKQQMREMTNSSGTPKTGTAATVANSSVESSQSAHGIDEEAFLLQFFNENAANDSSWADESSQVICITHADPTTLMDGKMTSFYVAN